MTEEKYYIIVSIIGWTGNAICFWSTEDYPWITNIDYAEKFANKPDLESLLKDWLTINTGINHSSTSVESYISEFGIKVIRSDMVLFA